MKRFLVVCEKKETEKLTWVSGDECGGAVEPDNGHVRVDEDCFLLGVALVEEFEEWCEVRVAEVETLMVRQKDGADGAKARAGILNFLDTIGECGVIDVSLIRIQANSVVVLTLLGCKVGAQLHRKRIVLGKSDKADK